jgi:amidohydrolase
MSEASREIFEGRTFESNPPPVSSLKLETLPPPVDPQEILVSPRCSLHSMLPEIKGQKAGFNGQAAGWLTQILEEHSFSVERGICGLPTAFKSTYGEGRPSIALLAEYDAVPGLGHACGHNLIAMCAVAAAAGLAGLGQKLPGRVMVFGTPDEEGLGGKIDMIKENAFEGVDAALMIHPMNEWLVYNYDFALDSLMIDFQGKPAHYTRPWEGINALDTSTLMLHAVNIIRHQILPSVVIGYMILKGGEATSVVPDDVKMRITMKSAQGSYLSRSVRRSASSSATPRRRPAAGL